jgi:hypothetical protein
VYFIGVKKLMPNGSTLIVSAAARTGHKHDPWAMHSKLGITSLESGTTFAGMYPTFVVATLVDGSVWYYLNRVFSTEDDRYAYQYLSNTFTTPDGVTGFYGECYNFVYRSATTAKMTEAEFIAWIAAH